MATTPLSLWNQKLVLFVCPMLRLQSTIPTFISTLSTNTNAQSSVLTGEQLYASDHNTSSGIGKTVFRQDRLKQILQILRDMVNRGIQPDSYTYASLLQDCLNMRAMAEGKLVHAHIIQTGFIPDMFLETKLVIMYAKCGSLVDARRIMDEMPEWNVVSCTAMIAAYARHGQCEEALTIFYQMKRTGLPPDQFTFASILPAFADLEALEHGKEVHKDIIVNGFQGNVFIGSALVDMYAKCGSIRDAYRVFDKMSERNLVLWNAMIAGYAQNGHVDEALKLFRDMPERNVVSWTTMISAHTRHGNSEGALTLFHEMQQTGIQPNQVTYASVLPACAYLAIECREEIHEDIVRSGFQCDNFVLSALLDMYVKCGSIEDARHVFDKMPERNVVSWNVMIAGYTQKGHVKEALKFFQNMPERNVVSWTAMIAGYVQNGHFDEAMKLFRHMQLIGVKPDTDTFASVLPACASLAILQQGKEIHENIIRGGYQSDVFAGSALVDMYSKCGRLQDACKVFDNMPERNVVSWTVMIAGYAMHGFGKEALQLFEQMQHFGTKPNYVTFIGVLSACCHAGLVDDGWQYFDSMSRDYHIIPSAAHYCCMVDLLGRAGKLDEAQDFISKMPIKPDAAVWCSLLGACRVHANIELGERVAELLFELDPQNAAHYVLLSNIYAAAGRWGDIENVRNMMKRKKVKKMPGCSWIEVNNKVYAFLVGDRSHPQTQNIYAKLERLSGEMKEAGYVPDRNFVLYDVEDDQKEHTLYHHSEKLAIAFGLINTPPGTPIQIIKNLRVCGDCHSAAKFISKIVAREIVIRDANRFHHFEDGRCSCGDYW